MSIYSSIKGYFNERNAKSKEFKELEEQAQKEAYELEKKEYAKNLAEYNKQVIAIRAREKAMKSTGFAKLKAQEEADKASRPSAPKKPWLAGLGEYMAKNRARTLEREKKAERIAEEQRKLRERKMQEIKERNARALAERKKMIENYKQNRTSIVRPTSLNTNYFRWK